MPQVIGGVALVPPKRELDCACTFCGLFRAGHYWRRAIITTAFVPLLVWATIAVDHDMHRQNALPGETAAAVGGLLIVLTGAVVLSLASWYQPLRRVLHMLRPRR